jgi:hypothetical protein
MNALWRGCKSAPFILETTLRVAVNLVYEVAMLLDAGWIYDCINIHVMSLNIFVIICLQTTQCTKVGTYKIEISKIYGLYLQLLLDMADI